ncbi:Olfactory receptor 52E4 [Triplophysa tibetana]|uniref:Olfactory receptor 52E4 n=1 Tax=Triplophysa tibetana TaxID=1572043 RepID=A0A5A9PE10_9TELE|nr:Olfactory receptor 52E4 [Triplophysa tibetana]
MTYFTYTLLEPTGSKSFRHIYFTCFLFLYILILFVNIWVSVVIILERALHQPMYIFLCNLCINDILGATGFYPKFLHDLILDSYVIPSYMCAFQAFVIYSSVMCDCSTLTVMAYDRNVAICKPLNYHTKLNKFTCGKLICLIWIPSFIFMTIAVLLSNRLKLCNYNIHKLYCDNWSIVKLSCESNAANNIYGLIVISFYLGMSIFIIVSYIRLIIVCKASLESRRNFWQTCVPHIITMINFAIAAFFDTMHTRYGSSDISPILRDFLALEMFIVPPLFNPVVYGFKLKEVRKRLLKSCVNIMKQ